MNYEFPLIQHIDDVLPAIEGVDGFIVCKKDDFTIISYAFLSPELFGTAESELDLNARIRRECRGIAFDNVTGLIVSRPYHKFFNMGERVETQEDVVSSKMNAAEYHLMDKMDGSMIRPIMVGNDYRLATKMGVTDIAMQAEKFVAAHPNYDKFIRSYLLGHCTPIFEWCSRQNRIVIDNGPKDSLVLTAVRQNDTGKYFHYYEMAYPFMRDYGIDIVRASNNDGMMLITAEGIRNAASQLQESEGWVLRFADGHMVKVKSEWYVLRHKSKDAITSEKEVVSMIANETIDDIKSFITDEDIKRIDAFQKKFWTGVREQVAYITDRYTTIRASGVDRKGFALGEAQTMISFDKSFIFKMWDGCDAQELVVNAIKNSLGSREKLESARFLWGGHKWEYEFTE